MQSWMKFLLYLRLMLQKCYGCRKNMLENIFSTSMLGQRQKSFSAESKLSNARGCFSCSQTIGRERRREREAAWPTKLSRTLPSCSLLLLLQPPGMYYSSSKKIERGRLCQAARPRPYSQVSQVPRMFSMYTSASKVAQHSLSCLLPKVSSPVNEIQPTPYSHYNRWKFNFKYFGQLEENFDEALYTMNRTRYEELLKWYHTIVPRPGKWYR